MTQYITYPAAGNVPVYANVAALPATATAGDAAIILAPSPALYIYNGSAWVADSSGGLSPTLTSAHIFVGNGSNVATDRAMSGDATLGNTGILTIANNAVTDVKILAGSVSNVKMATMANNTVKANISGAATAPSDVVVSTTGTASSFALRDVSGNLAASNLSGSNSGDITLTAVGSSPSANGASLSGQALTLQPASASQPGLVSTATQSIAGAKTFTSATTTNNSSTSSVVGSPTRINTTNPATVGLAIKASSDTPGGFGPANPTISHIQNASYVQGTGALTLNSTGGTWSAGGYTDESVATSNDGYTSFMVGDTLGAYQAGLHSAQSLPNSTGLDIKYSIYLAGSGSGNVRIVENGVDLGTFANPYAITDVFSIERVGGDILYKQNGSTIKTSVEGSTIPLYGKYMSALSGSSGSEMSIILQSGSGTVNQSADLQQFQDLMGAAISGTYGNGVSYLASYVVADLPTASSYTAGLVFVSNEAGGATVAFSDGTNWRRVQDRAIVS